MENVNPFHSIIPYSLTQDVYYCKTAPSMEQNISIQRQTQVAHGSTDIIHRLDIAKECRKLDVDREVSQAASLPYHLPLGGSCQHKILTSQCIFAAKKNHTQRLWNKGS